MPKNIYVKAKGAIIINIAKKLLMYIWVILLTVIGVLMTDSEDFRNSVK